MEVEEQQKQQQQQRRQRQLRRRQSSSSSNLLPHLPLSLDRTSEATPPRPLMPASATSPSTPCCATRSRGRCSIGSEGSGTSPRRRSGAAARPRRLRTTTTTTTTDPRGCERTRCGASERCASQPGLGSLWRRRRRGPSRSSRRSAAPSKESRRSASGRSCPSCPTASGRGAGRSPTVCGSRRSWGCCR